MANISSHISGTSCSTVPYLYCLRISLLLFFICSVYLKTHIIIYNYSQNSAKWWYQYSYKRVNLTWTFQKPCTKRLTPQTQAFPFHTEWCLKTKIDFPSLLHCHALGILVIEEFSFQSTLHIKGTEQLGNVTNILWEMGRQKKKKQKKPAIARERHALSSWMSLRGFQTNQPKKSGLLIIIVPDVTSVPRSACHIPKASHRASNQAIPHPNWFLT